MCLKKGLCSFKDMNTNFLHVKFIGAFGHISVWSLIFLESPGVNYFHWRLFDFVKVHLHVFFPFSLVQLQGIRTEFVLDPLKVSRNEKKNIMMHPQNIKTEVLVFACELVKSSGYGGSWPGGKLGGTHPDLVIWAVSKKCFAVL